MRILAELLEDEKKEIQSLFERINSLNALVGTLADAQLDVHEENWLYEKLINDATETRRKFNEWWVNSCEKYDLDKRYTNKYYVDFITNQIILSEE